MQSTATGRVERIVPDGCPEIIVNLGDPFLRALDDGGAREQDACLVVGQLRTSLLTQPSGNVDLLGVRLEPAGLRAILGCSVRDLTDADVPLGDVCARTRDLLLDTAMLAPEHERVVRVEWLLRAVARAQRTARTSRNALAGEAALRVERMRSPTVGALACAMSVSARSIERAFADEIGIGPKEYIRIRRLQRVIRLLDGARERPDWAGLSAACGYCDQPHLVREFGLIAGLTPESYLSERTSLMDAFTGA